MHGLVCLGITIVLTGLMWVIRRHLRATTLLAPWTWALLAVWTITAVELFGATLGGSWPPGRWDAWRFIASTAALCPGIAVMGAKRPQDRAWKFIVASLWGVLALPAAKVLVLPTANSLTLHPAQSWFLLALVIMSLLNWLPTRFGVAAVLGCAGLVLLLSAHLPFVSPHLVSSSLDSVGALDSSGALDSLGAAGKGRAVAGLSCFLAAALWVVWRLARGLPNVADPRTRLWIEFRDLFGAFWSLRVAERWNGVAAERQWPMLLGWRGFQGMEPATPEGGAPLDALHDGDRTFHSLLRRFVDRDWIAQRC